MLTQLQRDAMKRAQAGWPGAMRNISNLEDFAALLEEELQRADDVDGSVH